jgi:Phage Mu protein F like protein
MPIESVLSAVLATAAAVRIARARTPGTPAGDADDAHEDNTFDLPNGNPIRKAIKRFAKRQLKKILGTLPEIGAPIPDRFPPLTDWTKPMAAAMTPLVSLYWDEGGRTTRARLGLDPDEWEVHDPHLHEMVSKAAFQFCESTNRTTDLDLAEALEQLRGEFIAGLVDRGDSIPELTKRVKSVFRDLATWRAEMIGRTEASRAIHAASLQSASESGVVQGKRWLTSANSCDRCVAIAQEFNAVFPQGVPLGMPFEMKGDGPYASIQHPPLHPHCRCSVTFVLTEEYEELLRLHPPETFEPGALGPEERAA